MQSSRRSEARRWLQRGLWLAFLLGSAARAWSQAPWEEPDTDWIDQAALQAGETSLRIRKDGPVSTVDVAILIDAPQTAIWDVLRDCEAAPEYVADVVSCSSQAVVDDGAAELFVQKVKPAFFIPAFEHVFRLDYMPYSRIDMTGITGPLEVFEGFWWLRPQADGTILLYYRLTVDPGIPLPRMFVRSALRRDLPTALTAVRDRAEAASSSP